MRRMLASDHRALVLESVASEPGLSTLKTVLKDCEGPAFPHTAVASMLWWLCHIGLLDRTNLGVYIVTDQGFIWLEKASFKFPLPELGKARPGARRKK
jgi:hypothetical protein